jgi:16S rRNA (cytosine967-C5)-methyltransferase
MERVDRVRAFADLSLHHALAQSDLAGVDRGLATELVYGALRWRGRIDFMLGHALDRKLSSLEPMVANTLRIGAYQILFSDRIPASAAVDESVRCARALGAERATGLVNAVLRRLARDYVGIPVPALEDDPLEHLVHALSMPEWIARRWLEIFDPADAAALVRASNQPPPVTIRANRLRISREALLASLDRDRFSDAEACALVPDGIVLGRRGDPGRDPAFLEGKYTVQDEAAQAVVELLDPQPGEQVLDTCAAPGTKTTAIAERVGAHGSVLALDRHARRLQLVTRDARRLELPWIETVERDASEPLDDLLAARGGRRFDRVLVDVPCSGLGSLRRNPDARWRIRASDVESLVRVQSQILKQAAAATRVGGTLVYSTCTILPDENEAIVTDFLSEHPEFRQAPRETLPVGLDAALTPEGWLRCLPHIHGTDGFFGARLERVR